MAGVGVQGPFDSGTSPVLVVKTADESVTSSTTLQNDDQLKYPLLANLTYVFNLLAFYEGSTTGDIKFAFTVPTGATLEWASLRAGGSLASASFGTTTEDVLGSGTVAFGGANGAGTRLPFQARGIVVMGSTAGDLQFQWAQTTSDAVATTVFARSFLQVQRA